MAQSIFRSLDKMELIKLEKKQKVVRFNFSGVKRSGKIVLSVKNLSFAFDSKKIFNNVSFEIEKGERVAIVAPNGTGKTTLLNVIAGKYKPTSGSFEFGHNVEPAIFEQDQNKSLNLKNEILQEIEDFCTTSEQRIRARGILGAFLFAGDDVYKRISVLSGGEKNRVAMVKVLLQDANLLILDEPTNHLDIESKDVLLKVLKQFTGTIIFVSHDRDFLNHLATHILDLNDKGIFKYAGNYDSYLYQKQESEDKKIDDKPIKHKKIETKTNKESYEQRKKLKKVESKIDRIEKNIETVSEEFSTLRFGTQRYTEVSIKLKKLKKDLEDSLAEWEKINE